MSVPAALLCLPSPVHPAAYDSFNGVPTTTPPPPCSALHRTACRIDSLLFNMTGRRGLIAPSISYVLDSAIALGMAIAAASTATGGAPTRADVAAALLNVSFVGATGMVSFKQRGRRTFLAYDFVNQVNGSSELLVAQWHGGPYVSSVSDFPGTPTWPGGARPAQVAEPSSCPRVTCPKCDRTVIIPIIVGVFLFLGFVALMLFYGRRQVGATLFLQTVRAEQSAKSAIHEAEVKSSFLANMSHEIRTPLHAILSLSRMMLDSRISNPVAPVLKLNSGTLAPILAPAPAPLPSSPSPQNSLLVPELVGQSIAGGAWGYRCTPTPPTPAPTLPAPAPMPRDEAADTEDIHDLSQIVKASETLEALVNDILFISKMQTAGFALDYRATDLCSVVEDTASILAIRAAGKNVECVVQLQFPEFEFEVCSFPSYRHFLNVVFNGAR
jgi:hypothetical protein